MIKRLCKTAICTDIHFGKKSNSDVHNQDCLDFITWFCEQVKADPQIDNVAFLGDWHENRSALNISTLKYSYQGAKMLNDLGMPVFFIIGNHDLYHRHTREIHSVVAFQEFKNFHIIDEPIILPQLGDGTLMSPYLFHHEYGDLRKHLNIPIWMGHFEFKDFVVTGYNITMPTGPDVKDYKGPKHIFSGHFHKRQANENVIYVGNTFPMDFSDAGDFERGMATYDFINDDVDFIDWPDCPKYIRTTLTDVIDNGMNIPPNSRVKCIVDVPISYEESTSLRQTFLEKLHLREFTMEESKDVAAALSGTVTDVDDSYDLANINDLMVQMLGDIDTDHIDNQLLIHIYKNIKLPYA